jgi:tripartite-type tricarboxylate transporter receptor subunit TctC
MLKRAARATIVGLALSIGPLAAQTYPDRPIKLIVPQPPGGGFDTVARVLAEHMAPQLGQPIIVENKPGAGTLVGSDAAAKSAPDGYTLLLGALSNIALNPGLYPKLPYDPLKDFTAVGLAVSWSYTLVARKDLPHKDLKELIADAKANPDKFTYASGGRGSGQHIAVAMIEKMAGVKLRHVPYRGAQAAYQDLLGGRVDLFFDISSTARAQVDGATVRALAVSSKARQPMHPEVPTVTETGVAPLDMESWFGLFAQAATPEPVLAKLRAAFATAIAKPEVAELFAKTGGTMLRLSPAEADALVRREVARWTAALKDAGITAE